MTFLNRFQSLFRTNAAQSVPAGTTASIRQVPLAARTTPADEAIDPQRLVAAIQRQPLPDWLADQELLRDEGTLFGLSDARPDAKIAQIRAYFASQAAPYTEVTEQLTETISEFNLLIDQCENRTTTLREQLTELRDSQPAPSGLVRHLVSLVLSVGLCVGCFFLIDETLQPAFSNRWIAVGVFLAGMFNLFGRTSFFYETNTRLTGRRLIEEIGLPLAASLFVLMQALQTQPLGPAVSLFIFIFFVFLLSGKLLLSTLTALQTEFGNRQKNRQLALDQRLNLPLWEQQMVQFEQEVNAIRAKKWGVVAALNQAETNLAQMNTQRDKLVNLFLSEFELARSLRDRLTEQQRNLIMNG